MSLREMGLRPAAPCPAAHRPASPAFLSAPIPAFSLLASCLPCPFLSTCSLLLFACLPPSLLLPLTFSPPPPPSLHAHSGLLFLLEVQGNPVKKIKG